MVSLMSVAKAQYKLAAYLKGARLGKGLTQEGLSQRSGVSLATLRKFEQKGVISLESFLKLSMALGILEKLVEIVKPQEVEFSTIDDVLNGKKRAKPPQRGRKK